MKNRLTINERDRLQGGTIYVTRSGRRVRVDAGDAGVVVFDGRYRTLAAALRAECQPNTRPPSALRIAYDPSKLTRQ